MPSIPQSLLWISLVVLWLFVLVPMLISKRDAVRRTSDVALATRVLNGGAGSRLVKRGGPAAGHRSDPHWTPEEDPVEEDFAESAQEAIDMVAAAQPDVMLLDLNLEGSSGFDVLRALPVDSTVGVLSPVDR